MLISEERIRELAIDELRLCRLALTRQFLSVHKVVEGDSGPSPACVVGSNNRFDVYFRLADEAYFLVLTVAVDEVGGAVEWCRTEANSRVYLSVTSETVPPAEVTARLGLTPTESWQLGDPRAHGQLTYSFHAWFLEPDREAALGECDQKMKLLLDRLEGSAAKIRALVGTCHVEIRIVYTGYQSQMWGLHWDAETLQRISALGVDVDVDLYASGPDLPS